jgi:MFS family permease
VTESPVWLARQRHLHQVGRQDSVSLLRIFRRDLLPTTLQTSVLIGSFMFSYYSITFWYATFLRESGRSTLAYLIALNLGGIAGDAVWGHVSEGRPGRRGAATMAAVASLAVVPLYLFSTDTRLLVVGALLMGIFGVGMWGVVPTYLSERFPTAVRGVGAGFAYHAGAALGALTPYAVGALQDSGWTLPNAMALCIVSSLLIVVAVLWLGPETRGHQFQAADAGDS